MTMKTRELKPPFLKRALSQYEGASPNAIASGSTAQMIFFIEDAKHDIAALASELQRTRDMLAGR
jgi:hypothetical protein